MNKEFDYKSIRIIAVVFPALIITMGLMYGMIYFMIDMSTRDLAFTIFLNTAGSTYPLYMLYYLLSIAFFVSLFRLSGVDPRWNAAMILMMISLILETFLRIFEWQSSWLEYSVINAILVALIGVAPEAVRVAGMICFLSGIKRIRKSMRTGKKEAMLERENRDWQKVIQFWISAALIMVISIPVFIMLYLFTTVSIMFLLKWVGFAEAVTFLVFSVMVSRRVWSFCQEYYLYQYNQGSVRGI